MKISVENNEEQQQILAGIIERDKQERLASATLTSDTLSRLNINIENLPQRCQQLLQDVVKAQSSTDIVELDPIAMSLCQTRLLAENLEEDYEIIKLQQKNAELQQRIDSNKKFLEGLRRELKRSKESLAKQSPGPDDIQDYLRQVKQKVASYEENCEKAKAKLAKLAVPDAIMPKSLNALVSSLRLLSDEANQLRQRADDVTLAREAVEKLHRLRK